MSKKQEKKEKKKMGIFKKILLFILILLLLFGAAIGGFVAYSTYKNGWGMKGMLTTIVGQSEEKYIKDLGYLVNNSDYDE